MFASRFTFTPHACNLALQDDLVLARDARQRAPRSTADLHVESVLSCMGSLNHDPDSRRMFDSGITSSRTGTVPDSDWNQSPDDLHLILHDPRMIRAPRA